MKIFIAGNEEMFSRPLIDIYINGEYKGHTYGSLSLTYIYLPRLNIGDVIAFYGSGAGVIAVAVAIVFANGSEPIVTGNSVWRASSYEALQVEARRNYFEIETNSCSWDQARLFCDANQFQPRSSFPFRSTGGVFVTAPSLANKRVDICNTAS